MIRNLLLKGGGLTAVVGSQILVIGGLMVLSRPELRPPVFFWIGLCALGMTQAGLIAMYFNRMKEVGPQGLVGFLLALLSTVALMVFQARAINPMVLPDETRCILATGIAAVGYVAFGIIMMKSTRLPKAASLLWMVGAVLYCTAAAAQNPITGIAGMIVLAIGLGLGSLDLLL